MMKIEYDDICGGAFTITNLGMYGVRERFTPIINLPEVAILGVNKVSCRLGDGEWLYCGKTIYAAGSCS